MNNYGGGNRGSPSVPATHAVQGTLALVGGLALLIFKGIIGIPLFGVFVGVAMLIGGFALRNRGTANDSFSSFALIVLGVIALATIIPGLGAFTLWLMGMSAFGLIAFGVWRLWQYSRSRNGSGSGS